MEKVERWIDKLMSFLLKKLFVPLTIVWSIVVAMLKEYGPNAQCNTKMRLLVAIVMTTSVLEILIFIKVMIALMERETLLFPKVKRQCLIIIGINVWPCLLALIVFKKGSVPEQMVRMFFWAPALAMLVAGIVGGLVMLRSRD